jgi:hypothetical protein
MHTIEHSGGRAIDHVVVIAGQGPYQHLARQGLRRLGAAFLEPSGGQRFLSNLLSVELHQLTRYY